MQLTDLILYVCSQLPQPLYPGIHDSVTEKASALVTVTLVGGCGVVRTMKILVRAATVAT